MSGYVITCATRFGVSFTPPSSLSPTSFLISIPTCVICARVFVRVSIRVYVCIRVEARMWRNTSDIGRRRRVNLIVGFWVSASRRHRVCFDDDEGNGAEIQGRVRRERWRRTRGGWGYRVPDKTAGVPTPVAGHPPHEIRHCHFATTTTPLERLELESGSMWHATCRSFIEI